jgi:hypothetical protein
MAAITIADNIYAVGTVITAKVDQKLELRIVKYYQRIYYCVVVSDPERKQLAYFERELVSPVILSVPEQGEKVSVNVL